MKLILKINFNGDLRRIQINKETFNYEELKNIVKTLKFKLPNTNNFHFQWSVSSKKFDIHNEAELKAALAQFEDFKLEIFRLEIIENEGNEEMLNSVLASSWIVLGKSNINDKCLIPEIPLMPSNFLPKIDPNFINRSINLNENIVTSNLTSTIQTFEFENKQPYQPLLQSQPQPQPQTQFQFQSQPHMEIDSNNLLSQSPNNENKPKKMVEKLTELSNTTKQQCLDISQIARAQAAVNVEEVKSVCNNVHTDISATIKKEQKEIIYNLSSLPQQIQQSCKDTHAQTVAMLQAISPPTLYTNTEAYQTSIEQTAQLTEISQQTKNSLQKEAKSLREQLMLI
eukprot:TRINITY_DN290_c0_g1_i1.p1 TRINITY_DN290_c0_g1~~TRINITY_DN290_c0_g1_i1.p1  ORF type:complete len:341 (-),score=158.15 TRINITY_DN290_c0_g1_i1:56-1078(-)